MQPVENQVPSENNKATVLPDNKEWAFTGTKVEKDKEDLEGLLKLAEELLEKHESGEKSLAGLYLGVALPLLVVMGFIVFVIFMFSTQNNINKPLTLWLSVVPILIFLFLIGSGDERLTTYIKNRRRDARALYEVVQLLREVEGVYAKNDQWSTLERAQFRIRLSRFDIGTSPNELYYALSPVDAFLAVMGVYRYRPRRTFKEPLSDRRSLATEELSQQPSKGVTLGGFGSSTTQAQESRPYQTFPDVLRKE